MWEKDISEAINLLDSKEEGLTKSQAEKSLQVNGKNEIPKGKKKTIFNIFLGQFKSPIILILIIAAIFSIIINSIADAIFIFIVIGINAIIGTAQEWNSERSAEKLQNMIKIKVKVLREGKETEIGSSDIVVRRYCKTRIWMQDTGRFKVNRSEKLKN